MINKTIFAIALLIGALAISSCKKEEEEPTSSNTAPVANDDDKMVFSPGTTTFSVTDNDTDADDDSIYVTAVTTPSIGSVVINNEGKIAYTISTTHSGTVTIEYTLSDGQTTSTATITLTVQSGPPCCLRESLQLFIGLKNDLILDKAAILHTNRDNS